MSAGAMYCQTCGAKKGRCDCHAPKQRSRSGERGGRATGSDEPMAAAGSIEDIITKAAERAATMAGEARDARWEERMESLISAIEKKQDANIADLKAKIMKEVRDLRLRQDQVEKRGGSGAGSVADSAWSTAASGARDTRPTRYEHVPKKVDIKGFVKDWEKREEQGLTQPEVARWVRSVHEKMPEGVRGWVDLEGSVSMNSRVVNTIVSLKLVHEGAEPAEVRNRAFGVRKAVMDILAESNALDINGVKPRVVVQAPEWKQPIIKAGAKAMGLLQQWGVENLKTQWTMPMQVYWEPVNARPLLLVEFSEKAGWSVHEGNLKAAGVDREPAQVIA